MNAADKQNLIAQHDIENLHNDLECEVAATEAVVARPEVVAVTIAATDVEGKRVPNSQRVRERIAVAKANNETMQDVIQWAMAELKQTKGLATRYVVENWDRDVSPKRGTCKLTVGKSVRGVAPRAVTNADQVRELIEAAKLTGEEQAVVVERATVQLGQAKSVATRYVNENWERVVV